MSALTVIASQLLSDAVQVRVVVATPSEWMEAGENAQADKLGATFGALVMMSDPAATAPLVAPEASLAVTFGVIIPVA
jgi:hypothetical protein